MICSARRRRRICSVLSVNNSSPASFTEPAVGSMRRITDFAVVVLPQPDSPTSERVSPRATSKLTPSTACTGGFAGASQRLGAV